MIPPYASRTRALPSADWTPMLIIQGAVLGRAYAIRIKGASLSYRVIADGLCGSESLATGTISASPTGPTRVTGLPDVVAAARLVVEVQGVAGAEVSVEASWIPLVFGPNGGILTMDAAGVVVEG